MAVQGLYGGNLGPSISWPSQYACLPSRTPGENCGIKIEPNREVRIATIELKVAQFAYTLALNSWEKPDLAKAA